ncbi:MAG: hypothetical protein WDA07_14210 [Leucobacter sp.]
MAIYRDPNAPQGTVLLRGIPFTDGISPDIDPSPETLRLFKAWGITELAPAAPAEAGEPAPRPTRRRK